ncbi:hypothetical protein Anapl_00889 [Anas platyrhynchos]|uniref:Uncharacterized protein n=1 Tax=Anas platyrhynchos TaxID=8839 RepID=R0JZL7_ANAPL|nr:hypothetical protein Anapl_00889 [Anas platyrhynchos]
MAGDQAVAAEATGMGLPEVYHARADLGSMVGSQSYARTRGARKLSAPASTPGWASGLPAAKGSPRVRHFCLSVPGITLQLEADCSASSSRRRAGPQGLSEQMRTKSFAVCKCWADVFPPLTGSFYILITVEEKAEESRDLAVLQGTPIHSRQRQPLAVVVHELLQLCRRWAGSWAAAPASSLAAQRQHRKESRPLYFAVQT